MLLPKYTFLYLFGGVSSGRQVFASGRQLFVFEHPEQGNASTQYNLGWMYDNGEGVPQDYEKAVKWYRLAAEQGYSLAQLGLGVMYDNGKGVPQDYQEAVKWYRRAAEQGNAAAQYNLGSGTREAKASPRTTCLPICGPISRLLKAAR